MSSDRCPLTIGIPTWNRRRELEECLARVIPQVLAEDDVEVMICDNASDDDTQTYVQNLVKSHPFIRYERNEINIGADRNFIEVLRRASGGYVWTLSDDDFIADGAVRKLLQIIKDYRPSYISVNYVYCDSQQQATKFQPDQRYMIKHDVAHADINRSFLTRNHWLSFLSCSIYRRELVDCEDLLASINKVPNWLQVYMTAQVLANGKDGYHSSLDAVFARVGNDRVDSTPFVAYMPDAFMFIFRRFKVRKEVAAFVLNGIKESFLSFPTYLACKAKGLSPSPLIVPLHYRVGLLFPRFVLLGMRRIYRVFSRYTEARQTG